MRIQIKYHNPVLGLGVQDLRNVWFLLPEPVRLPVSVHQGMLSYRLPKDGRRVSYRQLKQGLCKCNLTISVPGDEVLPF